MAALDLTSGAGLAAAIASFLNKDSLTDQIPAFVRLAEATFNRKLRTREMIARATPAFTNGVATLPTDFLEAKSLGITAPTAYMGQLTYLEEGAADDLQARHVGGGRPSRYSIVGTSLELAPAPDQAITADLVYYAKIPALDLNTPGATNWLLTRSPDIYLFGALVSSAPFLAEDERIATWGTLAAAALQDIQDESDRATTSGSRLNARRRTFG